MQIVRNLVLQRHIEAGLGCQIHPVEIVKLHSELPAQTGTSYLQPLAVIDLGHRRRLQKVAESHLGLEGCFHQRRRNHPLLHKQTQIAVGQRCQRAPPLSQIVGGTAVGDHQRNYLTQRQALLRQRGVLVTSRIQQTVYILDIGAKPDP